MRSLLTAFLQACAVLRNVKFLSRSSPLVWLAAAAIFLVLALTSKPARAVYEGPNEDPTALYTAGGGMSAYGCSQGVVYAWSVISACAASVGVQSWSYSTSGPGIAIATAPTPPPSGADTVKQCSGAVGSTSCGPSVIATATLACGGASNRALGIVAGAFRCVSTCYSLIGTDISVFVPIDDAAQTILAACFFVSGKGSCEITATDTSNFTYGSQLYRGGTWTHVGQRCTEDPSDAPTISGVGTAPTGGTGSGASDEGNTAATSTATATALTSSTTGMETAIQERINALDYATNAPLFEPAGGRWLFSLSGFMPSEACSMETHLPFNGASLPITISVCAWADYSRAFFFWAFALITLFGIWSILFRSA